MSGGYFITGTDTGVGKTVVAAAVLRALCEAGHDVAYMKPVQTGCVQDDNRRIVPDLEYAYRLAGLSVPRADSELLCPYRFLMPASPHLAAARESVEISTDTIMDAYEQLTARHAMLIVEGAGGVLVPLNGGQTMIDLMQRMDLPVIVACRAGLGTLNHTLLTLRALRRDGLTVAGLVMVQTAPGSWGDIESDNEATLRRLGQAPVLGRIMYHPALADETADAAIFSACLNSDLIHAFQSL